MKDGKNTGHSKYCGKNIELQFQYFKMNLFVFSSQDLNDPPILFGNEYF